MTGEKIATREAYGKALAEFGKDYKDLVVLDADLSTATKTAYFKEAFPDRFFDCGIAENNMFGVAAGLAASGKIPFASTFAMFAAGRSYEQIRNSIGYPHMNVKIGATHGGVTVGEDGATHQCIEDFALMRVIPGMTVICTSDAFQTRSCVKAVIDHVGPVYMRFGRMAVPTIYDNDFMFTIGKGYKLAEGTDVTLIATGIEVNEALTAVKKLASSGISAELIDMPTIKPLDSGLITASAAKTGAVVTCEEHSVIGGLGGAVSELVSSTFPVPVIRVGVNDTFGKSGPAPELVKYFKLDSDSIVERAIEAVTMKNA